MALFGAINTATSLKTAIVSEGGHTSNAATYVSGTGTAGTANTAMTVLTRTLAANTLTQLGDRMRIRVYFFAAGAAPITVTGKVGPTGSETSCCDVTHTGGAASGLVETWMHYIDNTHANIIEQEVGSLGALTAVNVAGFTWNASQNVIITQSATAANYITVYGVFVDVFPKAA